MKKPAGTLLFPNPANPNEYAQDLLQKLGDPETPNNIAVIAAWGEGESATFPGYNLLGTTLGLTGSTAVPGNTAGVQEYPTLDEGLAAAVDMMRGQSPQTTALTPALNKDLKSGNASLSQLAIDVGSSGWDGSGGDAYDQGVIASKLNLGTLPQPTGATTSQGGGSGATYTTSGSSSDEGTPATGLPGQDLSGFAGVLQTINGLLNPVPASNGVIGSITGLFTGSTEASIAQGVEGLAIRLFFAAGFAAIAYIGIKTITGTGGGGSKGASIIEISNKRQGLDLANRNLEAGQSNREARASQQSEYLAYSERQNRLQRGHETRQAKRQASGG